MSNRAATRGDSLLAATEAAAPASTICMATTASRPVASTTTRSTPALAPQTPLDTSADAADAADAASAPVHNVVAAAAGACDDSAQEARPTPWTAATQPLHTLPLDLPALPDSGSALAAVAKWPRLASPAAPRGHLDKPLAHVATLPASATMAAVAAAGTAAVSGCETTLSGATFGTASSLPSTIPPLDTTTLLHHSPPQPDSQMYMCTTTPPPTHGVATPPTPTAHGAGLGAGGGTGVSVAAAGVCGAGTTSATGSPTRRCRGDDAAATTPPTACSALPASTSTRVRAPTAHAETVHILEGSSSSMPHGHRDNHTVSPSNIVMPVEITAAGSVTSGDGFSARLGPHAQQSTSARQMHISAISSAATPLTVHPKLVASAPKLPQHCGSPPSATQAWTAAPARATATNSDAFTRARTGRRQTAAAAAAAAAARALDLQPHLELTPAVHTTSRRTSLGAHLRAHVCDGCTRAIRDTKKALASTQPMRQKDLKRPLYKFRIPVARLLGARLDLSTDRCFRGCAHPCSRKDRCGVEELLLYLLRHASASEYGRLLFDEFNEWRTLELGLSPLERIKPGGEHIDSYFAHVVAQAAAQQQAEQAPGVMSWKRYALLLALIRGHGEHYSHREEQHSTMSPTRELHRYLWRAVTTSDYGRRLFQAINGRLVELKVARLDHIRDGETDAKYLQRLKQVVTKQTKAEARRSSTVAAWEEEHADSLQQQRPQASCATAPAAAAAATSSSLPSGGAGGGGGGGGADVTEASASAAARVAAEAQKVPAVVPDLAHAARRIGRQAGRAQPHDPVTSASDLQPPHPDGLDAEARSTPSGSQAMAPPPRSADTVLDEAFFDTVEDSMDAEMGPQDSATAAILRAAVQAVGGLLRAEAATATDDTESHSGHLEQHQHEASSGPAETAYDRLLRDAALGIDDPGAVAESLQEVGPPEDLDVQMFDSDTLQIALEADSIDWISCETTDEQLLEEYTGYTLSRDEVEAADFMLHVSALGVDDQAAIAELLEEFGAQEEFDARLVDSVVQQ